MIPRPAAVGNPAERPDDATRSERYSAAKTQLAAALDDFLTAAIDLGDDDPSSTAELARQLLVHDVNAAVDTKLLAVPLSEVWTRLTETTGGAR